MVDVQACGDCGDLATQIVFVRVRGQIFEKALCSDHLAALLAGTRPQICDPRPPRVRGS